MPQTGVPAPADRGKRGKGHRMVPFPPLDSPKPSFEPLSKAFAAKRGRRGLGSVRRAAYMQPSCPEFTLRSWPRITVRGQTVPGACLALRKAPLRSSVYSWSTRHPCGPLAFRRATEGSRVLRKGWGVKRGRETLVSLPLLPPPPGGGNAHAMSWRISPVPGGSVSPPPAAPLYRRKICRLLRVKQKKASPPAAGIIRA